MATLSDFNEFGGPYSNILASVQSIQKMTAPAIQIANSPAMKTLAEQTKFLNSMSAALNVSQLRLPESYLDGVKGIAQISKDYARTMEMIRPTQLNVAADALKSIQRTMASLDFRVLPSLQNLESAAAKTAESDPEEFVSRISDSRLSSAIHQRMDEFSENPNIEESTENGIEDAPVTRAELNILLEQLPMLVKQGVDEALAERDKRNAPKHPKLQATAKYSYELFMTVIPNVAWYLQLNGASITLIQNLIVALTVWLDPSLGSTFPTRLLA